MKLINPFDPNVLFLYHQGVEKLFIGNEWVKFLNASFDPQIIWSWVLANYPLSFTCSKSTIETLEKVVQYVQS